MRLDEVQKHYYRFDLNGEVYLAVYPNIRAIHIDYTCKKKMTKSFFCDYQGNIICPHQTNYILKKSVPEDKKTFFLNHKVSIIFLTHQLVNSINEGEDIYINLNGSSRKCVMRILYSCKNFSLGAIIQKPDVLVEECLKLIPKDMENWNKLIINKDSFRIYME
ncbi:MAG: hypothetical protein K9M99_03505 [Candidatus Cloacimonetes bacterium]|nr:hypothetical protein [Candidatus Cloacimonadota bacterium]